MVYSNKKLLVVKTEKCYLLPEHRVEEPENSSSGGSYNGGKLEILCQAGNRLNPENVVMRFNSAKSPCKLLLG